VVDTLLRVLSSFHTGTPSHAQTQTNLDYSDVMNVGLAVNVLMSLTDDFSGIWCPTFVHVWTMRKCLAQV
jgi:hypothetical protein